MDARLKFIAEKWNLDLEDDIEDIKAIANTFDEMPRDEEPAEEKALKAQKREKPEDNEEKATADKSAGVLDEIKALRERVQDAEQKLAERPAAVSGKRMDYEVLGPVLDFGEKSLIIEDPKTLAPGEPDLQAKIKDLQEFNDLMLTLSCITGVSPRKTHLWKHWVKTRGDFGKHVDEKAKFGLQGLGKGFGSDEDWEHSKTPGLETHFKASVDTSNLSNWIPTFYSRDMIERIRYETGVWNLFPNVTMPESTMQIPLEGSDPTVYKKVEGSSITESTIGDEKVSLAAVGVAARTTWTDEVNQDSLVALMPEIRRKHALRLAEVIDFNCIAGDLTGDAMGMSANDSAPTAYNLWDGVQTFAYENGTNVDASDALPDGRDFIKVRQLMQQYAQRARAFWLLSPLVFDMLLLTYDYDTTGYRNLILNPNGNDRALLGTAAPTLLGMSIVQSDQVMTNLDEVGKYGGTASDRTVIIGACIDGWITGDRRNITVETDKTISTGKLEMVLTWRGDMKNVYGTSDPAAEMIYNVDLDF